MSFRLPRFDAPPRLDEMIATLPESATCLGLYFNDILEAVARARMDVDVFAVAEIPPRRYFPFFSYPYADITRLIGAAAKLLHPRVAHGEAMRRIGHTVYDRLFSTRVGQVLFGVIGRDVQRVLLNGPRGYGLSLNFGQLTAEATDERRIVYHFRDMPALLETYQVGVIEGALRHLKVSGNVRIDPIDLANADIEITWAG